MTLEFIYDEITLKRITYFASTLSEKDKRAYAAVEAYKLGYGGVNAIASLLGMSPETLKRGREDLDDPSRLPEPGRQRHQGAGRKGVIKEQPGLEAVFDKIVKSHLGGDPMNIDVIWTDLLPSNITSELTDQGYHVSENTVRSLLKKKNS